MREATPADVSLLLTMIRELAEYERLSDQVETTEELLASALFGDAASAEALIAELDGEPVGYAIFFSTFSTFLAIQGVWLEDLYVRPAHRKAGAGKALLAAVAAKLRERGGRRMEWAALDWNELALGFYRGLGAHAQKEWITHRLIGEDLDRLAAQAPPVAAAPRR
ncbi:MAG TPA: GNAT family N-acetyltransferase [Solirubrobacteraceae bacterium]|nr:GNAT family N-acetyltransferase [Solirubrobacteraceae bacterium]